MAKLTPQQEKFAERYLSHSNGTQAAIEAGYSEKSAAAQATRLLKSAKIKQKIAETQKSRRQKTEVDAERVLRELYAIGLSDIGTFVSWSNEGVFLKKSSDLPKGATRMVESIAQTRYGIKIKLHPKVPAIAKILDLLGIKPDGNPEELIEMFRQMVQNTAPGEESP